MMALRVRELALIVLAALLLLCGAAPVRAEVEATAAGIVLDEPGSAYLGRASSMMIEIGGALEAERALALQRAGRFSPVGADVPKFGIGSPAVWLHLRVDSRYTEAQARRVLVGTSWIDRIDLFVVRDGQVVGRMEAGDGGPGLRAAKGNLGFVFEHVFEPGVTELLVRAETPDPLVLPLRVFDDECYQFAMRVHDFTYGLLYGFLLALIAYNAMLYAGLRDRAHRDYVLYLGCFVLLSMGYGGHGYNWLWPGMYGVQRYIILVLMVVLGYLGLRFASSSLGLAVAAPRAHRLAHGFGVAGMVAIGACVVLDQQAAAAVVAFVFVLLFSVAMVWLGFSRLDGDRIAAGYFLAGSLAAMAGAATTSLAVWNGLPYSNWTFHAAEVGIAIDGAILSLALAYRVRRIRRERLQAEQLSSLDPLTGLRNRRAFAVLGESAWSTAVRRQRPLSAVVLDLDHFKLINDVRGHAAGDAALKAVAGVIERNCRAADVAARWGGEEFVVLLPETTAAQAGVLAERLLHDIRGLDLTLDGGALSLSASIGVAERTTQPDLEALVREADQAMYAAKQGGRDRVVLALPA
ncbi:MAG TPA: GGDEF domain-containing protein [Thauera sp.]|nr:GGDEF domain-containing protein [Thauera sp.]